MKRIHILLPQDQIDYLDTLDGNNLRSEHIRKAITEYITKRKAQNVSASQSGGKNGSSN